MHKQTTEIRDLDQVPTEDRHHWQPIPDRDVERVRKMDVEARRSWLASQVPPAVARKKRERRSAGKAARKARRANRRK